jgi:hypothetical protein
MRIVIILLLTISCILCSSVRLISTIGGQSASIHKNERCTSSITETIDILGMILTMIPHFIHDIFYFSLWMYYRHDQPRPQISSSFHWFSASFYPFIRIAGSSTRRCVNCLALTPGVLLACSFDNISFVTIAVISFFGVFLESIVIILPRVRGVRSF